MTKRMKWYIFWNLFVFDVFFAIAYRLISEGVGVTILAVLSVGVILYGSINWKYARSLLRGAFQRRKG